MAEKPTVKLEVEIPASELKDAKISELPKSAEKADDNEPGDEPTLAGYKPANLLAAPLEKPKPVDKRPPNVHQARVIMLGLIIVVASLIFGVLLGLAVGVSMAAVGAFIIVVSVFLRI